MNCKGAIFIKEFIVRIHSKTIYIMRIYNSQYSFVMTIDFISHSPRLKLLYQPAIIEL